MNGRDVNCRRDGMSAHICCSYKTRTAQQTTWHCIQGVARICPRRVPIVGWHRIGGHCHFPSAIGVRLGARGDGGFPHEIFFEKLSFFKSGLFITKYKYRKISLGHFYRVRSNSLLPTPLTSKPLTGRTQGWSHADMHIYMYSWTLLSWAYCQI